MDSVREAKALIDKLTLSNIGIVSFADFEDLLRRGIVEVSSSPIRYITQSGQEFTRLNIENDKLIDKMFAGAKCNGWGRSDYCNMTTTIKNKETGNLVCYTMDDYVGQLLDIQNHLWDAYGIEVDFSDVAVKEMEINKTFKLEGDFREYHRVLNLIMTNLPYYMKSQMDYKKVVGGDIDYQTYYATSKESPKSKRYMMFKVYNKTKALSQMVLLTDSYIRFEISLIGSERVQKAFGTNRFSELTDEAIDTFFHEQIQKMVIKPYLAWKKKRDKEVLSLMKETRIANIRHWQVDVLRTLQNKEIEERRVVLLDVEELMNLVDKMHIATKRKSEVKNNFRKQAERCEMAFCQRDDKKLEEVLKKLQAREVWNDSMTCPRVDGLNRSA